ncbi:protein MLN51 homolog isoform X2 [Trifolium pratense]|uniref:protein MLN51 homolog isoform X2 n=1 Tax=Trifolium pratense TaxID=57577 RepID=UPI001E6977A1|nr:protein MLN51 homolog isoform X2 [Trifolium pratense]XP_045830183.1 protein MLN51 homolog isoform X2 [Trifolium pratense]
MANSVEEDVDYESDPKDERRRRKASDDEEEEDREREGDRDDDDSVKSEDLRVRVRSDDSDGEGGVADYDDDDDENEEIEEEEEYEEVEVEEEEEEEEEYEEVYVEKGVDGSVIVVNESVGDVIPSLGEDSAEVNTEEKKENEPFAVPTAGAFYMHDDRFRDNSGARQRRMHGGRRLWESKDDKKWGHDKFEEISVQDRRYDERRRPSRGNFRGRGRARGGTDRGGHVRGNRREYNDREYNNREFNNREYNDGSNQNQVPKVVVKGRGPRRYEPTNRRNGPAPQVQNKQSGKSQEKTSHVSSERVSKPASNAESDPVPAKKNSISSNLNYASPPFYPSGSSNKEINLAQKQDVQIGSTSRNIRPGMNEGFPVQQNNAIHRGKNVVDSISMDKLYIDESVGPSVGKPLNNVPLAPSGHASQSPFPRPAGPGRGAPIPLQMNYPHAPSHNQANKVSPMQMQAIQRSSVPGRTSTSAQAAAPQTGHRPGSGSQSSSPPKRSVSINSLDSGDLDASSESGKAKGALVGKGRGAPQGAGRGPFVYGGAQVMGAAGNMAISQGDPNFPAFLPVMQFGGQHPAGMGVPAVGMAFPGYVPGKSEMTWLPVLAGAAGALGAQYCSPYLTVDGAYGRQPGQTSAIDSSSKENNVNKANNNELKPPQKSDLVNDEYGQRQNKPRRYSEMNFGQ